MQRTGRSQHRIRGRSRLAFAQRRGQHAVVRAFERRAADVLDPDLRNTVAVEIQKLGGTNRQIDDAVAVERSPVIDAHDDGSAIGHVGDTRVARDRQRRMRGRDRLHVEDFAVRGAPAMESVAIPRRDPLLAVFRIFLRYVGPARDHIGLADAVCSAALRHRLAERDDARAGRHAVFRIDLAADAIAIGKQHRTGTQRSRARNPAGRHTLMRPKV
jgi:hypothetical protein